MKETQNYKLGLWEAQDEVGREGLNGNFSALDAALKGEAEGRAAADERLAGQMSAGLGEKAEVVTGRYTGSYSYDVATASLIDLGGMPRAVWVVLDSGASYRGGNTFSAFAGRDLPSISDGKPANWTCRITARGFEVRNYTSSPMPNNAGQVYHYLALM